MAIQTRNRTQVLAGQVEHQVDAQQHREARHDRHPGTRKARGRSGRVRRSTITPTLTSTNANSVPMLTRSASVVESTKPDEHRDHDAGDRGDAVRACRSVGWTLARPRGSSPSRAMAKATRVWPSIRISTTDGQADAGADGDEVADPVHGRPASKAVASGAASLGVDVGVLLHAGDDQARPRCRGRCTIASEPRMPIGHVALRVLGLLGGGGDDVEADEGEEDDRGAGDDAADAEDGRLDAEAGSVISGVCPEPPLGPGGGLRLAG